MAVLIKKLERYQKGTALFLCHRVGYSVECIE